MPKPLASVSARFVDTSMIVPLDSMKFVPLCGAATSVMECTQLLLPPVNSGLGVVPAALAAATSSALPFAISSRNRRVVAPPKLWPTRFTARRVPQPSKSGRS